MGICLVFWVSRRVNNIMRVTIERTPLLRSLTHVYRVVERRNTIPILSNVLLRGTEAGLALKATDLDLEVAETIPAMIDTPGATTVPAHILHDIVRKLPDGGQVVMEASGDQTTMSVQAGRARFTLQMLPEQDFPAIIADDFSHSFAVEAASFKRLIDRTQFAISSEETRYYLNGIYLHQVDVAGAKKLRAVATDGHRLAQAEMAAPQEANGMPGVIVPRKTVAEIQRLLAEADNEDKVAVDLSETKIRITCASVVMTSKLIDSTFPDYERVIPRGNDKELKISCDDFTKSVDRVSTISTERGRAVKLSVSDDRLVLTVNNPESGSATEEVQAGYTAEPLDIGFNSKYLLDIAGQLQSDEAVFMLADPGSPTLIRDGGDEDTLYVLMPMRV